MTPPTSESIVFTPEYPISCKMCGGNIPEGAPHVSEKAWKKYGEFGWSVLFEITLCANCLEGKQRDISLDSRLRIQRFLSQVSPTETDSDICSISGKRLSDCDFVQGAMVVNGRETSTIFISDDALEALQEQLSSETRDALDRFTDEQLGPPGAWKDLFSPTRPILI